MPLTNRQNKMFDTRSHSWREAGLIRQIDVQAVKRARLRGIVLLALFVGVVIVNNNRYQLLGVAHQVDSHGHQLSGYVSSSPADAVRWGAVLCLLIIGWGFASAVGSAFAPTVFRRMDPATSGTVGFFTRLITIAIALLIALRAAGVNSSSLTLGASFTAVVLGLAAQQTLGNVIAGMVLLSARPFRVGDRVRLQAGGVGGQVEGVVSSLGLLYTSLSSGDDVTMVPNSVVLNSATIPLREPDSVDLRARLRPGVTPRELQGLLEHSLKTPVRDAPRITLEELDGEEVVVRINATPQLAADGPALATEVLSIVSRQTRAAEERAGRAGETDGDAPTRHEDEHEDSRRSERSRRRVGSER